MRHLWAVLAVAAIVAICGPPNQAEAKPQTYYSFQFSAPGLNFFMGRYPRPYYYRYSRRPYANRSYGGRCQYWSNQCVRNWGYRNPNYFGCLRYHRCR